MDIRDRLKNDKIYNSTMLFYAGFMTLFYVFAGGYLIYRKQLLVGIPYSVQTVLGVMMILYGLFRGYRIFNDRE